MPAPSFAKSERPRTRLDLPQSCAGCFYNIENVGCCHSAVEPESIGRAHCKWKKHKHTNYWFDRTRAASDLYDFGSGGFDF